MPQRLLSIPNIPEHRFSRARMVILQAIFGNATIKNGELVTELPHRITGFENSALQAFINSGILRRISQSWVTDIDKGFDTFALNYEAFNQLVLALREGKTITARPFFIVQPGNLRSAAERVLTGHCWTKIE